MTTLPSRGSSAAPATIVTAFYEESDDRIEAVLTECGYQVRHVRYAVEIWDLDTRPAGHLFAHPAGDAHLLELHGTSIWLDDVHEAVRQLIQRRRRNGGEIPLRVPTCEEMDDAFRTVLREAIAEATPKP
jgi:hypothetical protein